MTISEDKKLHMVELGSCKRPHGIRGGLSIHLYNPEESVLKAGDTFLAMPLEGSSLPAEGRQFTIEKIQFGNKVTTSLKEVCNRDEIEKLIPFTISVSRESFPEPEDGEIYLSDLEGMEVFDHTSGELIGKLVSFYNNGAQDVWKIEGSKEVIELPFVDAFFPVVDVPAGRVEINRPEYI